MKKAVRSLITLIMAAIMIFAIAVPASAQTFDFEQALEEKSPIQTLWFAVGEENLETFFDKIEDFDAVLYSSDEDVIEINGDGTYSAVGEGKAYIAVVFPDGAFNLYTCDVKPSTSSSTENAIGATDDNSGTVDAFDHFDKVTSERYEKFEDAVNNMREEHDKFFNKTNNRISEPFDVMSVIGPMIFFAFVGTVVYIIVTTILLSKTSMGKKKLPGLKETENTVKVAAADRTHCPKCGKEYGEASFCTECGISKSVKNQYVVPINKRITAQKFEKMINAWLAENPYIYNCKIKLNTRQSVFIPFVGYKFFIKNAVLEFNVADKPQNHQYGFAFLYKFRLFGPLGYNTDKHVAQWNKNNPDCKVVSSHGGRIQHWDNKGGFYAQYYNYVFFKKG